MCATKEGDVIDEWSSPVSVEEGIVCNKNSLMT